MAPATEPCTPDDVSVDDLPLPRHRPAHRAADLDGPADPAVPRRQGGREAAGVMPATVDCLAAPCRGAHRGRAPLQGAAKLFSLDSNPPDRVQSSVSRHATTNRTPEIADFHWEGKTCVPVLCFRCWRWASAWASWRLPRRRSRRPKARRRQDRQADRPARQRQFRRAGKSVRRPGGGRRRRPRRPAQALKSTDEEVHKRAEVLVGKIEKRRESAEALKPKHVHLVYKDTPADGSAGRLQQAERGQHHPRRS